MVRKLKQLVLLLAIGVFIVACKKDDDNNNTPKTHAEKATYRVKVIGNWSGSTHPTEYPSNSHFSPVIGMTSKPGVRFFDVGELASDGMEIMAETGGTSPLDGEINAIVASGKADQLIKGSGLSTGTSSFTFEIEISYEYPEVTLVSMIAPSPDWFVAVENVTFLDDDCFLDHTILKTTAYDAGTDSGPTFKSPDDDTNPADEITLITKAPLGDGSGVDTPLMIFEFTRIE